jgi:hypothetical protein
MTFRITARFLLWRRTLARGLDYAEAWRRAKVLYRVEGRKDVRVESEGAGQ